MIVVGHPRSTESLEVHGGEEPNRHYWTSTEFTFYSKGCVMDINEYNKIIGIDDNSTIITAAMK